MARRRENMVPSHRAPPPAAAAAASALDGCPSNGRPPGGDRVEEREGALPVGARLAARALEDRLAVDAVGGERVAAAAHPPLDDRRRHLGMELQADAPPERERVRA